MFRFWHFPLKSGGIFARMVICNNKKETWLETELQHKSAFTALHFAPESLLGYFRYIMLSDVHWKNFPTGPNEWMNNNNKKKKWGSESAGQMEVSDKWKEEMWDVTVGVESLSMVQSDPCWSELERTNALRDETDRNIKSMKSSIE